MLPFSTLLLRSYYAETGWNEDNLYSNLTRSSAALLVYEVKLILSDFPVPDSLILQLANSPSPIFFNSYALDALPQLNGSMSYVTSSAPLTSIGSSRTMPLRDVVERFRLYPPPQRPSVSEIWLDGKRIDKRDYLFYSRVHFPSFHVSGLATTRVSPTVQAQLAFTHQPTIARLRYSPRGEVEPKAAAAHPPGNLLLSLQHDTGQYSGEYTYSASDGMFGLRGLYNFGWQGEGIRKETKVSDGEGRRSRVDDEEELMEGVLRGRFSAGGEIYLSLKQRSLGVSIGGKFTTLPASSNPTAPPSPPTTISILYNPLMGFISTAYAAQLSPTVALATRFGVNIYSYESDFSVGGEWWIGRRLGGGRGPAVEPTPEQLKIMAKRALLGGSLRDDPGPDIEPDVAELEKAARPKQGAVTGAPPFDDKERDGVLKASLRGDWSLALLYESRIRNCLVSVGLVSDVFSGTSRAIRGVGLEVQYYS